MVCAFFWSKSDHCCSENKPLLNYHFILGLWEVQSDNSLSHKVLISILYSFIHSLTPVMRKAKINLSIGHLHDGVILLPRPECC